MAKRILIFHPFLAPYRIDLYNRLADLYEVRVLLTGSREDLGTLGFNLHEINRKAKFDYEYYSKGLYVGRHLISTIYMNEFRNFKPDIVISHELGVNTIVSMMLKKAFNFRLFTTIDDSPNMSTKYSWKRNALQKIVMAKIDGLFVVNPLVKDFLLKKYDKLSEDKIHYLPLLQDDVLLHYKVSEAIELSQNLKREYNLYGKKIVLFVGRLEDVKAPNLLLQAFKRIQNKDTRLVIVGGGTLEGSIKEEIRRDNLEDKIILTGPLFNQSLYAWYCLAHIFVLPSKSEAFGAVVNEALVSGCYTILSDVVGASAILNKTNGCTFVSGDANDLKKKIEKALFRVNSTKKTVSLMDKSFEKFFEEFLKFIQYENRIRQYAVRGQ